MLKYGFKDIRTSQPKHECGIMYELKHHQRLVAYKVHITIHFKLSLTQNQQRQNNIE
jgi:hypothetical protein